MLQIAQVPKLNEINSVQHVSIKTVLQVTHYLDLPFEALSSEFAKGKN